MGALAHRRDDRQSQRKEKQKRETEQRHGIAAPDRRNAIAAPCRWRIDRQDAPRDARKGALIDNSVLLLFPKK
jgi:hypothetical protein